MLASPAGAVVAGAPNKNNFQKTAKGIVAGIFPLPAVQFEHNNYYLSFVQVALRVELKFA